MMKSPEFVVTTIGEAWPFCPIAGDDKIGFVSTATQPFILVDADASQQLIESPVCSSVHWLGGGFRSCPGTSVFSERAQTYPFAVPMTTNRSLVSVGEVVTGCVSGALGIKIGAG